MAITPKTVGRTLRDVDDRGRKLFSALEGEDDLGVVLRAHIYIEHELKEYILELAPKPEHIKFLDYEYNGVVALALALGLSPELKPALSSIGGLRNRFAHKLDMTLTKQEANSVYNSLSAEAKSNVHQGYASMLKMPQYADWPKSIKHLLPKRLFGMCVAIVRTAILLQTLKAYARTLGVEDEIKDL